ncbi:MAG: GDSL-type esterase/lipase family protein [Candidatus Omnitrophota bacterium]
MRNVYYWLIIAVGLGLRFWHFLENRSLWGEEAKYAVSILSRSFKEIFYYVQVVPDQSLDALGFYLVEKLVVGLFGPSEYALRLYPLICSVISLFLFLQFAKLYLKPRTALLALGLFACSDALVYFAAEVKPYSSDVLMCLVLLLYFEHARRLEFNPKSMLTLSVLGATVIWFSNISLFVLVSVGLCLADQIISFKYYKRIPSFIGVISVWMVSFIVLYLVAFSHLVQSHYVWSAIKGKFSNAPFWSTAMLDWVIQISQLMFEFPAGFQFPLVASITFLTGLQAVARKNMERFSLIIIPFLIVFIMGCFKLYPVFGREILFLCPMIYIFVAAGLGWLGERFGKTGLVVSLVAGFMLLSQPITVALEAVLSGREQQQNRQVMEYFKKNYKPGDGVCLNMNAFYPFVYYVNRRELNPDNRHFSLWGISDSIIPSDQGRKLPISQMVLNYDASGAYRENRVQSSLAVTESSLNNFLKHGRVWLIFSNPQWPSVKLTMDYFNRFGERRQGVVLKDSAAFLFDMTGQKRFRTRSGRPIVFIGDSFFALNDWASFLDNDAILNLGIVGEKIAGVYRRLDEVAKLNPEKIFLMVGINDQPSAGTADQMLSQYDLTISKIREQLPDTELYVHSLLPTHDGKFMKFYKRTISNADIRLFNQNLKITAERHHAVYIDVYPTYEQNGQLNPAWTTDGLHLNREGYRRWKPALEQYIP